MPDRAHLRAVQYVDDSRFSARFELHRRFGAGPARFHAWVFDQLRLPPDARVLEIGCGPGQFWETNAARVPAGWRLVLTDFSPGMIAAAGRRLGDRAACAVADAEALPFRAGRFHAAIANHMLYHVPDRRRAARELARVLRPDGVLLAATNGADHLRELDELAARWAPDGRIARSAGAFSLANGAEQLGAGFGRVEMLEQRGELVVTEAEPIAAYVRSMTSVDWDVEGLRGEAAAVIEREGAFRIRTHAGVFVAGAPIQSGT